MKKILVTGSSGQLGLTLKRLVELQYYNDFQFTFLDKKELNIISQVAVETYFHNYEIDYCINCAAFTDVDKAEDNKHSAYAVNAEGTKNLALACFKHNAILLHISTDYVFDGNNKKPYKESDKANPINVYGQSKLKGENYIREILDEFYIIRTSWLYSEFGNNFVKTILTKLNKDESIEITKDQTGTPTNCQDLSNFIITILREKNKFGTYNFSAKGQATWFDFAKEIAIQNKAYNPFKLKPIDSFKTRAKRPRYSVLDLNKTLMIYPHIRSWQESLKQALVNLECSR